MDKNMIQDIVKNGKIMLDATTVMAGWARRLSW